MRRLFFSLLFTTILLACPVFNISALADSLSMVSIPGGTFQMGDSFSEGSSNERPVHTVTLNSFYMGKYEITNGQYCQYLNSAFGQGLITVTSGVVYKAGSGTSYPYCDTSTASSYSQIAYSGGVFSVRTKSGRSMANDPMVQVSWYGAVAYCNWRSQQEGKEQCYNLSTWVCDFNKKGYRLATEAEWEYAARGGLSGKRFPWGDTITHSQANYYSSSTYSYDISPTRGYHPTWNDGIKPYTSVVGSFSANGYGLYDMAGNVLEWCNDWYSSTYYSSSPPNNPTGPTSGSYRVVRGGGWAYDAGFCRVVGRDYYNPGYRGGSSVGFRVVLNVESPPLVKKRLIIDTDPAVGDSDPDDGTAIIYAFQSPELCTIEGITYGYGNFGHQIPEPDGITRGSDRMLDYYLLQLNKILEVLQEAGAIDTVPPIYRGHKESETWDNNEAHPQTGASDFIRETVRDNPGQITVVALGTLTNIATAIAGYPDGSGSDPNGFMRDCRELWIIGGAIIGGPGWPLGNVPNCDDAGCSFGTAEWNIWRDKKAAEYVFKHSVLDETGTPKIKMVPLNATMKWLIKNTDIEEVKDSNTRIANYLDFPLRWWINQVNLYDHRQMDPCENRAISYARSINALGGLFLPTFVPSFPPYDTIGIALALEQNDANLMVDFNDHKVYVNSDPFSIDVGATREDDTLTDREKLRIFYGYNEPNMRGRIVNRWKKADFPYVPENKKFIECSRADYVIKYDAEQNAGPRDVNQDSTVHIISLVPPLFSPPQFYYHLPVGSAPYLLDPIAKYRGRLIFDVNLPQNAQVENIKLHIYCDKKKEPNDIGHRVSIYYCDPQENDPIDFWDSANPENQYVTDTHIGTLQSWRTVNLGSKAISKIQNVADGGQFAILLAEDDDDHPCAWFDTSKDWKAYLEVDFDIVNIIDFEDLAEFVDYWLLNCSSPSWCNSYDFNQSGRVDFVDFAFFADHWLEGI